MKFDLNISDKISEKKQAKTHNELKQIQINDNDLLNPPSINLSDSSNNNLSTNSQFISNIIE